MSEELSDVRTQATELRDNKMMYDPRARSVGGVMIRILDAFDALAEQNWTVSQPADDGLWHILNEAGESVADDESPLIALLDASDNLKSMEPTDG